ncbi:MAG: hypothetical protein FWE07_07625 [Turicibacter sp.]|nr:hypothetical protein [Turicibacter sp.]
MKKILVVTLFAVMFIGLFGINAYAYELDAYDEVPRISLAELSERAPAAPENTAPLTVTAQGFGAVQRNEGDRWVSSANRGTCSHCVRSRVESFWNGTPHQAHAFLRHHVLFPNAGQVYEPSRVSRRATHFQVVYSGQRSGVWGWGGSQNR